MSYPNTGTVAPDVASLFSAYYDEWQAFLEPALNQKNGLGLGGRIAFNITPNFGLEGSYEYIMAKTAFSDEVITDLETLIDSLGYSQYLETKKSGGSISRYYGNLVFSFPSAGGIIPYITAGIGITSFKIEKNIGPEVNYDVSPILTKANFYYENVSALTFNGGFGFKFLFSPNAGIRFDARIFYCKPEFKQKLDHTFLGISIFSDKNSYTQTGSHVDTSVNVGFFISLFFT
jgi:opacity protein-like surface antigen